MAKSLKIFMNFVLLMTLISLSVISTNAEPTFNMSLENLHRQAGKPPVKFSDRQPIMGEHRPPSPEEFEQRLNLTEEQISIAKKQREEGIVKIKPIMDDIRNKRAELEKLKASGASNDEIIKLDNEIKNLHRQAHEIRRNNMKAFEATLSETQKKELQKMKDEGRKQFDNNKKTRRYVN